MRNDSSLNYNTKYSKIQNFKDFEDNIRKEKDELKKVKRGFKKTKDGSSNLANVGTDKLKFNKITHKTDNNFGKDLVSDFIDDLDTKVKDTDHKYKMEKTQDKAKMESYQEFVQKKMIDETPQKQGPNFPFLDPSENKMMPDNSYSDDSDVTSYMFFGNLQTIHRQASEILEMDKNSVDQILSDGHNWAEDHITSAKVQVTQVYNFLMGEQGQVPIKHNENHNHNYMFFANLETITNQCQELSQLDESGVDDLLVGGHDWAEDHITSAKENIEQVYEFLQNEIG